MNDSAEQACDASRAAVPIAGRLVGRGNPCFVIAEAGVNHNGSAELAHKLVDAAFRAGADAVKFQTFVADVLAMPSAEKAGYQTEATGAGCQRDMLAELELPFEEFTSLQKHCRDLGLIFLSSPFDAKSLDFLDRIDVAAIKVPSGEVTNVPYLTHVGRKGRPVILSTGMATEAEIAEAVRVIDGAGATQIVVLHCISAYPAPYADINLRAMETLERRFNRPTGLSDHSLGVTIPIAAAALSACMLEKHLTLDRALPGPDHKASLEPAEFGDMVEAIRHVEVALGDGQKVPTALERDTAKVARKSLHARYDLPAGTVLSEDGIIIARPENGLPPAMLDRVIGRELRNAIACGEPIRQDDIV